MRYYLVLEQGFTRDEYNRVRHVDWGTETAAIEAARGMMQSIFREERDRFSRYNIVGINKQGYSANIAILAD